MADQTNEMTGLVDCLVRPLVEDEDQLNIVSSQTDNGTILIEVHVSEQDAGKVIGRQGRVIKSVRALARAAASRSGFSHQFSCRSRDHRINAQLV